MRSECVARYTSREIYQAANCRTVSYSETYLDGHREYSTPVKFHSSKCSQALFTSHTHEPIYSYSSLKLKSGWQSRTGSYPNHIFVSHILVGRKDVKHIPN